LSISESRSPASNLAVSFETLSICQLWNSRNSTVPLQNSSTTLNFDLTYFVISFKTFSGPASNSVKFVSLQLCLLVNRIILDVPYFKFTLFLHFVNFEDPASTVSSSCECFLECTEAPRALLYLFVNLSQWSLFKKRSSPRPGKKNSRVYQAATCRRSQRVMQVTARLCWRLSKIVLSKGGEKGNSRNFPNLPFGRRIERRRLPVPHMMATL
jgi:hypothetical protein